MTRQDEIAAKAVRISTLKSLKQKRALRIRQIKEEAANKENKNVKPSFIKPGETVIDINPEELKRPKDQPSAKVEETAKRLSAYTLGQGMTEKPKLKQVKTTHLIKLKKL